MSMPKTWGALESNKTLTPCKYDYASFYKRVTPKHSLSAQCKNETYVRFNAFVKQTEHRAKKPCKYDYASFFKHVTPKTFAFGAVQKRDLWLRNNAFMKQTEHRAKKPCKYDCASFFKRVSPKHSLLARCKNRELWHRNKPKKPIQVWVCPKHEGRSKQTNTETMQIWLCLVL